MTAFVSFTVENQYILDHMCDVHGFSRVWESAKSTDRLMAAHELAHKHGLNMMIEHTHKEG